MQLRKNHSSRQLLEDWRVLTGFLYVMQSGKAWEMLPHDMERGASMTC
jgi:hypothetical protein